jgi:hypothetical protein
MSGQLDIAKISWAEICKRYPNEWVVASGPAGNEPVREADRVGDALGSNHGVCGGDERGTFGGAE